MANFIMHGMTSYTGTPSGRIGYASGVQGGASFSIHPCCTGWRSRPFFKAPSATNTKAYSTYVDKYFELFSEQRDIEKGICTVRRKHKNI